MAKPPVIAAQTTPYQVTTLDSYARLTGTVAFTGTPPADTIVHVSTDADVCGQTLVDVTMRTHGTHLAGAVVWLNGVTAGKHLPYARRFDIVTQGCRLLPRVQAAIVGGTIDVRSADPTLHRTKLSRDGTVLTTVPETEEGQVVPAEGILTAPGMIEVTCDLHSWSRGWIAVFDHPYYTMTGDDGQFAIDSIPPGRYKVTAWHERFGTTSDSVVVPSSGSVALTLTFRQ
jgi:hypothetical protein